LQLVAIDDGGKNDEQSGIIIPIFVFLFFKLRNVVRSVIVKLRKSLYFQAGIFAISGLFLMILKPWRWTRQFFGDLFKRYFP
jgi:hypothetical protein